MPILPILINFIFHTIDILIPIEEKKWDKEVHELYNHYPERN